jgi:hypothetical protein
VREVRGGPIPLSVGVVDFHRPRARCSCAVKLSKPGAAGEAVSRDCTTCAKGKAKPSAHP